jgi:copper transport protein
MAALGRLVPRFSRVAFVAVMVLLASGVLYAIVHLPTLGALWETSYGVSILIKAGLLLLAMFLGGVNMLRNTPRLEAAAARKDDSLGAGAAALLRRMVSGEVAIVVGVVFVAGILSSLPPPSKALGEIDKAAANVGPGPADRVVTHGPYRLAFTISPNRAALPNDFAVRITKGGQPVRGAQVITTFAMLDMDMPNQEYELSERSPGLYERHSSPALVMAGHWGLDFEVTPPGGTPFNVIVVDRAGG